MVLMSVMMMMIKHQYNMIQEDMRNKNDIIQMIIGMLI